MNLHTNHNQPIRILISGIGGVGGYYAGLLSRYSEFHPEENIEIYFHMRPGEHYEKTLRDGLTVESPSQKFTTRPYKILTSTSGAPCMDFSILATKSYNLKESVSELIPILSHSGVVLPLLNGLDVHDQLQELLPEGITRWVGVVFITSRRTEPGKIVSHSVKERLFMGDPLRNIGATRTPQEEWLEALMQRAGISAIVPDDPMFQIRKKFLMLSNSAAATAYWDTDVDGLAGTYKEFTIGLTQELIALYQAKGWSVEEDPIEAAIRRIAQMPSGTTTSMHSDLKKGNPSELSSLVEYVVTESQKMGLETPFYKEALDGIRQKIKTGYYTKAH